MITVGTPGLQAIPFPQSIAPDLLWSSRSIFFSGPLNHHVSHHRMHQFARGSSIESPIIWDQYIIWTIICHFFSTKKHPKIAWTIGDEASNNGSALAQASPKMKRQKQHLASVGKSWLRNVRIREIIPKPRLFLFLSWCVERLQCAQISIFWAGDPLERAKEKRGLAGQPLETGSVANCRTRHSWVRSRTTFFCSPARLNYQTLAQCITWFPANTPPKAH